MEHDDRTREGLFVHLRRVVRERWAVRVRVVCDPPDGTVVSLTSSIPGHLVAVDCEGLRPFDALEALAQSGSVTFASGPLEQGERAPLISEDCLSAWLATRGAYVPNVLVQPP